MVIYKFYEVTFHMLTHLQFIIRLVAVRSSLPCINIGVWIEPIKILSYWPFAHPEPITAQSIWSEI